MWFIWFWEKLQVSLVSYGNVKNTIQCEVGRNKGFRPCMFPGTGSRATWLFFPWSFVELKTTRNCACTTCGGQQEPICEPPRKRLHYRPQVQKPSWLVDECIQTYLNRCIHEQNYLHTHLHVQIFACIYTNIYMWINCLHLHICMYIHTYTNTNTSPRTFAITFFYTCANTFTYSCFLTEACSCTFTFSCTFSFSFTLHTHRFVGTWALSKSQGLECVKTLHHDHPRRNKSFRWTFSPNSSDQKNVIIFPEISISVENGSVWWCFPFGKA